MVFIGYTSIFLYAFFLIFVLGDFLQKKINLETSRKIIHILLFGVWVLIDLFLKNSIHQIIVPVIFLILNALSYKYKFYKGIERTEGNHLGTVYFAIAITVILTTVYFIPELYYYAGISIVCLTIGDGFAALIGYNVKSSKILKNKSVAGFIACFLTIVIGLLIFKFIYFPELSLFTIFVISIVSAILELVDYGLDNFSITFGSFALCVFMETNIDEWIILSLVCSIIVFLIVFLSKAIDYYGSLLSMVIVFLFFYVGGVTGGIFLLLSYFAIFLIELFKKITCHKKTKSGKGRNILQIIINGGLGTVAIVLYGITDIKDFFVLSMIAIGGNFVDSVSSEVGALSKKNPYDFWAHKHVTPGLSGGVTVLGTVSALVASILIGLYGYFTKSVDNTCALLIIAMVFFQSILDSMLGSKLQVKYYCNLCGSITEEKLHCGNSTEYYCGCKRIDNNCVNLISSILIFIISLALLHAIT